MAAEGRHPVEVAAAGRGRRPGPVLPRRVESRFDPFTYPAPQGGQSGSHPLKELELGPAPLREHDVRAHTVGGHFFETLSMSSIRPFSKVRPETPSRMAPTVGRPYVHRRYDCSLRYLLASSRSF